MASLGALSVTIGADTSGLNRGVRDAQTTLSRFGRDARQTVNRLGQIGIAAGAAGAAIVAGLVRSGMQAVDEQAKLARSMGATIDGLRGLTEASQDAGVSQQVVASSAQMLNQRLGEARRGVGTAAEALRRLNLDANELSRMDADERMATLADRMQELGYDSSQAADELRQLGIRNREMALLMIDGGDAIRGARNEIDEFGLSISQVDARQIEMANDAFRRVSRSFEVVRQQLAIALAPLITEVSNRFNAAAREAGGWRDEIASGIETAITWLGRFMDVVEGVRRTFQLMGNAAALAFAAVRQGALEAADVIVNFPTRAANNLVNLLNQIPGMDLQGFGMIGLGKSINEEMQRARSVTEQGVQAMHEIMMRPMPSTFLDDFMDGVRDRAREAAQEVEGVRGEVDMLSESGAFAEGGPLAARGEDENETRREQLARRLEMLQEYLMNEQELEMHRHEQRMEELREFLEMELLTNEEFAQMREELEQKHMERLNEIRDRGMKGLVDTTEHAMRDQVAGVIRGMNDMVSATARGSQEQFGIAKGLSAAVAVLKGWEAAQSAWAAGMRVGGPPVAAAFTAASLAKTGAQLASLRSTSLSRNGSVAGGGGSSGGGSAPAQATSQAQPQAGPRTTIQLVGQSFGQKQVRDLLEELNSTVRDGGRFAVA